jgi:hypothetical protein
MISSERKGRADVGCSPSRRGAWGGVALLALILGIAFVASASASAAGSPSRFPERDVTIEGVRVLPRGTAREPSAIRFDRLSPAAQAMIRDEIPHPETNLYEVFEKQTIHLGGPRVVRIGPREEFEFRRVGIRGGSVECASLVDGVVMVSGSQSSKELSEKPYLCGHNAFNSHLYVVAWVRQEPSAPGR